MDPQHIGSRRLESYRSYRSLKKRDFANSVNSDNVLVVPGLGSLPEQDAFLSQVPSTDLHAKTSSPRPVCLSIPKGQGVQPESDNKDQQI